MFTAQPGMTRRLPPPRGAPIIGPISPVGRGRDYYGRLISESPADARRQISPRPPIEISRDADAEIKALLAGRVAHHGPVLATVSDDVS